MTKRQPPSRLRYEAEHPTLTIRVPAEVKEQIQQAAEAKGMSISAWVQAMAGGHTAKAAAAYRNGLAKGRTHGRKIQAICDAAVLWRQYGQRLGSTDDCWFDRLAVKYAKDLTEEELRYPQAVITKVDHRPAVVEHWHRDSHITSLWL